MQVGCPHCGFVMIDDGSLAGQLVACPNCSGQLMMPGVAAPLMGQPVHPGYYHAPGPMFADGGGPKNSGIAAVMSFVFPGLGQIYNGEIGKGVIAILVYFVSVAATLLICIGIVPLLIVWVWAIYDAYNQAERINLQARKRRGATWQP